MTCFLIFRCFRNGVKSSPPAQRLPLKRGKSKIVDKEGLTRDKGDKLCVGNEQSGLPDQLAKEADALARIPQEGRADSLNLAVATAIMLFEVRRHLLRLGEAR